MNWFDDLEGFQLPVILLSCQTLRCDDSYPTAFLTQTTLIWHFSCLDLVRRLPAYLLNIPDLR